MLGGGHGARALQSSSSENVDPNSSPSPPSEAPLNSAGSGLEVTSSLPPSPSKRNTNSQSPDSQLIESMESQISELKERLKISEGSLSRMRSSCKARDHEIERLGSLLSGGRDYDELKETHAREAQSRMLDQLNRQVDFLNGQLAMREGQMSKLQTEMKSTERTRVEAKQAVSKVKNLEENNSKLSAQVNDLEHQLSRVQHEFEATKTKLNAARKAASIAKHEGGVRDSAGSLPGSVGSQSPVQSPSNRTAHGKKSQVVTIPVPPPPTEDDSVTVQQLQHAVKQSNQQLTALQRDNNQLRFALNNAESEATQLNSDNDRLFNELNNLRTQSNITHTRNSMVDEDMNALKTQLQNVTREREASAAASKRANSEVAKLREIAGRMTEEISNLQAKVSNLSGDNLSGNMSLDALRNEVRSMKEMLSLKVSKRGRQTNKAQTQKKNFTSLIKNFRSFAV